jgi:hypothetical protein
MDYYLFCGGAFAIGKPTSGEPQRSESIFSLDYQGFNFKKGASAHRAKEGNQETGIPGTFKDYKDSQLRSIINDPKNFADYAIQAASDILAKRKKQ